MKTFIFPALPAIALAAVLTASIGMAENPSPATPPPAVQGRPVSEWVLDVVSDKPATRLKALIVLAEVPGSQLKGGMELIWEIAQDDHENREIRLAAAKILLNNRAAMPRGFLELAVDGDKPIGALYLGSLQGMKVLAQEAWGWVLSCQNNLPTIELPGNKQQADAERARIEKVRAFLVKNMSPDLAQALAKEAQRWEKWNDDGKFTGRQHPFFKTLAIFKTLTAGSSGK